MHPYLRLLRPNVCLLSVAGLLVGAIIIRFFQPVLLFAVLAAFLMTGGGNAINDVRDVETDRINKPGRPIPSGKVSKRGAFSLFVIVTAIGLLLSFFVNPSFFLIALFNAAIMVLYAVVFKQLPVIGNLSVAYLSSSTFLAAGLLLFDFSTVWASPVVLLAGISLIGTFSRELMKSIEDRKGDAAVKLKTLPIVAGEKVTRVLAYISLLAACAILLWAGLFVFNLLSFVGFIPVFAVCALSYRKRLADVQKAQKLIKVAMVLVMVGFLVGTM